MEIGSLRVESVFDGIGRGSATAAFSSSTATGTPLRGGRAEDWAAHRVYLNDDGTIDLPTGGFLVRSGSHTVLIDAGIGVFDAPTCSFAWKAGELLDNLAVLGVTPEEVTDLVFTHLHFDHVGWASRDGQATFPSATYRCDSRDFAYFLPANGDPPDRRAFERLDPVRDRFELWTADGPLLAGIDVLQVPGHTPGSTVIVLSSNGERAMVLGDVVHCPVQLVEPEWAALGDVDPVLARKTRATLIAELESGEVAAASPHFPQMAFGRLLTDEGNRRFV